MTQKERLEELSKLEDNWNGYGAYTIEKSIIDFIVSILDYLKNWDIFPSTNATILLDYESKPYFASISVGIDEYSYASIMIDESGKINVITKGKEKLTKENIIKTIKDFEEYAQERTNRTLDS